MTSRPGALLYGAYGYTGRLVAEAAREAGIPLMLAGRREAPLAALSAALGYPYRAFALEDGPSFAEALRGTSALLLAAGPFSRTSRPALQACLAAGVHYLDITGEVDVFEAVFARDAEARKAGITLLPGCGFDVVPSDCLAASLALALPGARRLALAFRGFKASGGTLRTMLESAPRGGLVRRAGELVRVPAGWKTRTVPFADKPRLCMTIPWGDLSTAFRSTGIGEIETYMSVPSWFVRATRLTRPLAPLAGLSPVRAFLGSRIDAASPGPTAEERDRERSQLWGEVEDGEGRVLSGSAVTREGYSLTADSSVRCLSRVLAGEPGPGAWTPSRAFGPGFLATLPGTTVSIHERGFPPR